MLNAQFPVYAACFVGEKLVVGGGGGAGNHGVPNKLASFALDGTPVSIHELAKGEDNPTCIASDGEFVFVGANRDDSLVGAATNPHLRIHNPATLEEIEAADFLGLKKDDYTKCIAARKSTVACCSANLVSKSSQGSESEDKLAIRTSDGVLWRKNVSIHSIAISPDGRLLAAATASSIVLYSLSGGVKELKALDVVGSHVVFVDNSLVVISNNARKGTSKITSFEYELKNDGEKEDRLAVRVSKTVNLKVRITAVAATSRAVGPRNRGLLALGTQTGQVLVYQSLNLINSFRGLHKFPVTALAVCETNPVVASTSLDGTIHLKRVSFSSINATIGWILASSFVIAIIAMATSGLLREELSKLTLSRSNAEQGLITSQSTTALPDTALAYSFGTVAAEDVTSPDNSDIIQIETETKTTLESTETESTGAVTTVTETENELETESAGPSLPAAGEPTEAEVEPKKALEDEQKMHESFDNPMLAGDEYMLD